MIAHIKFLIVLLIVWLTALALGWMVQHAEWFRITCSGLVCCAAIISFSSYLCRRFL